MLQIIESGMRLLIAHSHNCFKPCFALLLQFYIFPGILPASESLAEESSSSDVESPVVPLRVVRRNGSRQKSSLTSHIVPAARLESNRCLTGVIQRMPMVCTVKWIGIVICKHLKIRI